MTGGDVSCLASFGGGGDDQLTTKTSSTSRMPARAMSDIVIAWRR